MANSKETSYFLKINMDLITEACTIEGLRELIEAVASYRKGVVTLEANNDIRITFPERSLKQTLANKIEEYGLGVYVKEIHHSSSYAVVDPKLQSKFALFKQNVSGVNIDPLPKRAENDKRTSGKKRKLNKNVIDDDSD